MSKPKSDRPLFKERPFYLVGEVQVQTLMALIPNLPIDSIRPLEVIIREKKPIRSMSANDRMWAGPLKDIAEQAWVQNRQFKIDVWHEFFKREFLPDEAAPDFDPSHVKEGYRKWDSDPLGNRILVGSTTELTVKGFAIYMTQVEAFGANLGVEFSISPNEGRF